MSDRLKGKVAIVTGAASGIGAAIAQGFVHEGARVAITDIQDHQGRQLAADLGDKAQYFSLNVADESQWIRTVKEAIDSFGTITTLVNNAGFFNVADVEQETREGFDQVVSVCETGCWLGMKTTIPALRNAVKGEASIVNISSVRAMIGSTSMISYLAAKGAVRSMTKGAAVRYAGEGIRVNSIHPGAILTPPMEQRMTAEWRADLMNATPLGRFGRPEEIAAVALFLASNESSFMTGTEVVVDGGWTAI